MTMTLLFVLLTTNPLWLTTKCGLVNLPSQYQTLLPFISCFCGHARTTVVRRARVASHRTPHAPRNHCCITRNTQLTGFVEYASCLQYPQFRTAADDFLKPATSLSEAISACSQYIVGGR